jgi:hypothetical protein
VSMLMGTGRPGHVIEVIEKKVSGQVAVITGLHSVVWKLLRPYGRLLLSDV